ncbi:uncharacterized protein LOC129583115 [Paramacrobiotus metropolitanus]|uniref:uncharacterized protein LOC129583115 n=1 Tax=Paramacrobiotus metropolitanus TaxID=2943436 RepID=UPI002445EA25|nr:uncharacterized protein LOC129583115 [Paramacrobiotus metropolitanus]
MDSRFLTFAVLVAFGFCLVCSARFGYRSPAGGIRIGSPKIKPSIGKGSNGKLPPGVSWNSNDKSLGGRNGMDKKKIVGGFHNKKRGEKEGDSLTGLERLLDFGKGAMKKAVPLAAGAAIAGGVAGAMGGEQGSEISIVLPDHPTEASVSVGIVSAITTPPVELEAMRDRASDPPITVNVTIYILAGTVAGLITIICTGVVCIKRRHFKDTAAQPEEP